MTDTELVAAAILLTAASIAYKIIRTRRIGGELPSIPEIAGVLFYWWARMWYCHLVAYDEYLYRYRREREVFTFDQKVILAKEKKAEAAAG